VPLANHLNAEFGSLCCSVFLQEQMNSSMQNKKNALMIFMTGL
jgi:hypothetical protein